MIVKKQHNRIDFESSPDLKLGLLELGPELLLSSGLLSHRHWPGSCGWPHPGGWGESLLQEDRPRGGGGGRGGCGLLLAGIECSEHLVSGEGGPDDPVLSVLDLGRPGLGGPGSEDGLGSAVPGPTIGSWAGVTPVPSLPQVAGAGRVGVPGPVLGAHGVDVLS